MHVQYLEWGQLKKGIATVNQDIIAFTYIQSPYLYFIEWNPGIPQKNESEYLKKNLVVASDPLLYM